MAGFAMIGLHRPKDPANVGGVMRAAMCYGASGVVVRGDRVRGTTLKAPTDTCKAYRHIPIIRSDIRSAIPFGAVPVAVDLVPDAESLADFIHPKQAFYIFGPEDGTLGREILDFCPRRVMIPTAYCMNLAATVNVVLYDRLAKSTPPTPFSRGEG